MYEDPISHFTNAQYQQHLTNYNRSGVVSSPDGIISNALSGNGPSNHFLGGNDNGSGNGFGNHSHNGTGDRIEQSEPDQELSRLHQHQLLIQLRLEVNSLKTQIQQLELLKQQLIHQRQMMQPAEYEQLAEQFSRTTASLLRVGHPSHFGDGGSGTNSGYQEFSTDGISAFGRGNEGGAGPGENYMGMHMMERLQEKLRGMMIQQHQQHYAQKRKQLQLQQQQQQQQLQQQQRSSPPSPTGTSHEIGMDVDSRRSGHNTPTRRDPVRMEQISLEADLRDLERRMRSIQLLH
ncbi:hypothetical protein BCR41DRAFT_423262 [Lobosporangium transversale]|uniref:Uncharacterized protein n=1 Tax=Lobosporangium transversale TaxID=64571 RepID=A0A1Y2GK80_9FUNG|nr:hypothetical protein BCR41DRAFT_423262 [Lobosporangium transversale]ORZ12067.1 hypothetical protein BCR41DRAFT_423262 [Lobosporangium transversale]|eukprot:XP_021879932.1 hypothetical protein BCR41DRAFT_423262 [Lobosporangium transversale]